MVFNVATGSLSGVSGSTIIGLTSSVAPNASYGFGLFYPQKGIIILNADAIDTHVGFHPRCGVAADTGFNVSELGHTSAVGRSVWHYIATPTNNVLGENTASAAVFVSASLAPFETAIGGTTAAHSDNAAAPRAAFTSSLRGASGVFADQYNYYLNLNTI